MNLAFYNQPVEKAIVEEILQWSTEALEKPSSFYNDLPPCPYARKAWMDDKVAILFKYDDSYQTFIDKDIWLMGFHPDDEITEAAEATAIEAVTDTEYSMIFVQRLSKLQEAADKLDKKGYYDSYDGEYNACEIFDKREQLYRRLKNGDETT